MGSRRRHSLAARSLLWAGAAALLLTAGCTAQRLHTAAALARASEPLQAAPERPALKLLVVGDSTAVGTGASTPERSLVGLIARAHPDWAIVNRGRDGARFADIAEQLQGAAHHDLVLVLGGGNDVIRLTARETLERDIALTLQRASLIAPRVIVMPAGNVGNAPFFFAPWSWWMTSRSRLLHGMVRDAAQAQGAAYVNLFKERADDPFAQRPHALHAADGLHPSDAGYAQWLQELNTQGLRPVGLLPP
jgi:lysophospholipase L1-like esterase